MTYARDTFIYPIYAAPTALGANRIWFRELGTPAQNVQLDLAGGRWYQHADATLHAAGYRGIWHAVIDALSNGSNADVVRWNAPGNTYTVAVVQPTASSGYSNGGIEIRAVSASAPFQISYTGGNSTLDARWLGYKEASPTMTFDSVTDGPDEVVRMPHGVLGRLVTHTLGVYGRARRKRSMPYKVGPRSAPIPSRSVRVVWEEGRRRRLRYEYVQGGFIFAAGAEPGFQRAVGLDVGDTNGAWEHLWDALTEGDDVIVVHNHSDDFAVSSHDYDIGRLYSGDDWGTMFTEVQEGGDIHHVEFELDLSHWGYAH